jgi:hypothetical protein
MRYDKPDISDLIMANFLSEQELTVLLDNLEVLGEEKGKGSAEFLRVSSALVRIWLGDEEDGGESDDGEENR